MTVDPRTLDVATARVLEAIEDFEPPIQLAAITHALAAYAGAQLKIELFDLQTLVSTSWYSVNWDKTQ